MEIFWISVAIVTSCPNHDDEDPGMMVPPLFGNGIMQSVSDT